MAQKKKKDKNKPTTVAPASDAKKPDAKKEQKPLPRLNFSAKNPQREHNSVYKKWHTNICAKIQHSKSATSHIRKPLYVMFLNVFKNNKFNTILLYYQ
jgi:hypothetical protein